MKLLFSLLEEIFFGMVEFLIMFDSMESPIDLNALAISQRGVDLFVKVLHRNLI
eukprot:m.5922 g.5922  ORF g.5922 m.5922 type:complete len:54 (+) comp2511_c0_seq1:210-371(+)